jgi:hypothetical protein
MEQEVKDNIIRAVAAAQSSRLFKAEQNNTERSLWAFQAIYAEICLSLYDGGMTTVDLMGGLDLTADIMTAMDHAGYILATSGDIVA